MKQKVSTAVQSEAAKLANGIKKPGQTKEQTKLIAAGIEKGIAEYKKLHKAKLRQQDKQKKQQAKAVEPDQLGNNEVIVTNNTKANYLPWLLLVASWIGFIVFYQQG